MTTFDPTISNGTCYWRPGEEAGSSFLPCGNVVSGNHFACCSAGDNCLTNGACFNLHFYATYLAACTDPAFTNSACPNKGDYVDQHWVGLVSCKTAPDNSQKTNKWVGCQEPDLDYLTQPATNCKCDATKPALFIDYNTMESVGKLPMTSGGTLSYFRGFAPTDSIVPVSTSTDPSLSPSATPNPSATSTTSTASTVDPTATLDVGSGMSTEAKAGIGAGAGLGLVFVACIAIMAVQLYKRRRNDNRRKTEYHGNPQLDGVSPNQPAIPLERNNTVYSGLSGYKAELAADTMPANTGTEMVSPLSLNPPQLQNQQRQYQAYNPEVHSRYSVRSDASGVSPSPGLSENTQSTGPTPSPLTAGTQHTMDIIAELEA